MANANISIITLSTTFDEWKTRTNDLITDRNALRNSPYVKDNSNFILANGAISISRTGGGQLLTITGGDAAVGGTTTTVDLIVSDDASVANQLSVTGNTVMSGNASVSRNVTVTQNVTIGGTLNVAANANMNGTTTNVAGNLIVNGQTVNVSGSGIVNGNLSVGTTSANSRLTVNGNVWITTGMNVETINATTVNSATLLTRDGINVSSQAAAAYGQANTAYGQANAARAQANTAYGQANDAYSQANTAYGQANAASNTVATFANGTLVLARGNLNFNNTATVNISVAANGAIQSNVSFTVNANAITQLGTLSGLNVGGVANISTLRSNDLKIDTNTSYFILNGNASFNNLDVRGNLTIIGTSTNDSDTLVLRASAAGDGDGTFRVKRGSSGKGNAEISFSSTSDVWQLTANANGVPSRFTILSTQNVVDSVTSTSTTGAAAPNAVKNAFDTAVSAANTVRVSGNSGSTLNGVSLNFTNTASINVTVTSGTSGNANVAFSANTSNPAALGPQGPQGVQGAQGVVGSQGVQGSVGAQGVQGAQGRQGSQGDVGAQGAQGRQGVQGSVGGPGGTGPQGVQGATGAANTATGHLFIAGLGVGTQSIVSNQIRATGDITAFFSSDRRLKENIRAIENALDLIRQIDGVRYEWTNDYINTHGGEDGYFVRKDDVGVIAQDMQKVLPEVVAERPDGTLAVRYDKIVALLLAAIKELDEKHDRLVKHLRGI